MAFPQLGDRVWYVLPSQRFVPAIVTRIINEDTVNLVVFAEPSEGREYATGTAAKVNVPRWIAPEKLPEQQESVHPPANSWFVPQGQFLPNQ